MEISTKLPEEISDNALNAAGAIVIPHHVAMVSCVYWENDAGWFLNRRFVYDDFFLFPVNGTIRVTLDDSEALVSPGEFLMLPSGVAHSIKLEPGHDKLEQFALHCHITSRWQPALLPTFPRPFGRVEHSAYWFKRLRELTSILNRHAELGQLLGAQFVKELLVRQVMNGVRPVAPLHKPDARIREALETIHTRFMEDLSVADMARKSSLSEVQFRKLFKRQMRMGPREYLLRHRLSLAAERLSFSRESVQQIAFACGFQSAQYFHRIFRQTYEITPLGYRKRAGFGSVL